MGGSNDYLTKPFDFLELEARIRNLLRRHFEQKSVQLRCGALRVNMADRSVFCKEQSAALTKKEYGILEYLLTHKGRILSAEEIIEHVWDSEGRPFLKRL